MSDWWTYRPADFLMFSARSWGRLLQAWNQELWPLQPVLVAAALILVLVAAMRPGDAHRWVSVALAAVWTWVGWAFHWERFSTINTGANWLAIAFAVQAILLVAFGSHPEPAPPRRVLRWIGLAVAAFAAVGYPLIASWAGRGWGEAEIAGAMPAPTALLTVGLLLAMDQWHRNALLVIPVAVLGIGWTADWLLYVR